MQTFAYRAVDGAGLRRRGCVVAQTPDALVELLSAEGLVVLECHESDRVPGTGQRFARRNKALIDFTRAIAGLLAAGLPLSRALTTAKAMTTSPYRECLDEVCHAVTRGESLAAAMSAHPGLFPPFYLGLVRAGERSADLPAAFTRLAAQLERDEDVRSRLTSAAIYPALLAVVGTVAILILMLFVLPRFAAVLEGAGARLPRSTRLLLTISSAGRAHWPLFIAPLAIVPLAVVWLRTEDGARVWAKAQLTLPVIGAFRRVVLAARFARLMSVLLASGTPVLGALDNAAASLADPVASEALVKVRARVREGARLSTALQEMTLFPALFTQLVALGEETGQMHEFLRKAADLFDQRSERALSRIVVLAEPVMIVVLAVIVGSVALSMLQAIYSVNASAFR